MGRIDGDAVGIAELLRRCEGFLITTHMNGDGDAFSSALALRRALTKMGKGVDIVVHDRIPDQRYLFLPDFETIQWIHEFTQAIEAAGREKDVLIALDVPNWERMGDVADTARSRERVFNIDHHESNGGFGTYRFVRPEASSTCELVYEIIRALDVEIDVELATLLYGREH